MRNRQLNASLGVGSEAGSAWRGRTIKRDVIVGGFAFLALALGCTYDPDERCDPDQELFGDALRCVCKLPKVWSPGGCVECPAGEVPTESGCICDEGQERSPEGVCAALPEATSSAISSDAQDAQANCDAAAECLDAGANP